MIATAVLATGAFAQSEIQKRLSATIVDEVDFRQFTLPQALQSLSNAVGAEAWVPVVIDPEADISDRTVTFSARRIRLSEALKIIAEVTDFWVQYHEDKVVFSSKCCPIASGVGNKDTCPHLVKQQYQSRRLVDALIAAREVPDWRCRSTPENQTMDGWFKDWVSNLGVKWHSGSSIAIDTNRSIITVINAPSEIDVFESIFYDGAATNWPKMKDIRLEAQQHLRQVSSEAAPSASPDEPSR